MEKKQLLKLIKAEIEWCEKNPQNMAKDWREGFIEGLKQAVRLIKKELAE